MRLRLLLLPAAVLVLLVSPITSASSSPAAAWRKCGEVHAGGDYYANPVHARRVRCAVARGVAVGLVNGIRLGEPYGSSVPDWRCRNVERSSERWSDVCRRRGHPRRVVRLRMVIRPS